MRFAINGEAVEAAAAEVVSRGPHGWLLRRGAKLERWWAAALPDGSYVLTGAGGDRLHAVPLLPGREADAAPGLVKSPMAGVVTAVPVANGERVAKGSALAVIEAMKMRYTVTAPLDGEVRELAVAEGARVSAGQALLRLEG